MKIAYFQVTDELDYEKKWLHEWKVTNLGLIKTDAIEDLVDCQGIVTDYGAITGELMEQCPKLQCVVVRSIGYNNIDIEYADQNNIMVCNVPGFCVEEVATHTIGLMLNLVRKISYYNEEVHKGKWNPYTGYDVQRLSGMVFGMVFFGAIPKKMVPVLKAFDMKIIVYAPTKSKEELEDAGCEKVFTLTELLERSDIVSLHCPLIKGVTEHLISDGELKSMKPSAFLINTSRGSVVDEKALVRAIKNNTIRGAAVDVIENEDCGKTELSEYSDRVIITPHAAYISEESYLDCKKIALLQEVDVLVRKKEPENRIRRKKY